MQEFFQTVLASEGFYCVVGININLPEQRAHRFFKTLEEADTHIEKFLSQDRDIYFGLSTFVDPKAPKPRAKKNCHSCKSFWLDIDCGEDKHEAKKGYKTKEDAVLALSDFLQKTKLPNPWVNDSGNGVHVYFPLEENINIERWNPLAKALVALCKEHNLLIDAAVTIDAARILRVPETYNFKNGGRKLVKVLQRTDHKYRVEELEKLLPQDVIIESAKVPQEAKKLSLVDKAKRDNYSSLFGVLAKKSLKGKGCNQVAIAIREQANTGYDTWRGVLSLAQHCDDRDTVIHKLSKKHPEYNYEATEKVAADTQGEDKGPFLCSTFERNYPEGCNGCSVKGDFSSPIVLARIVEASAVPKSVYDLVPPCSDKVVTTEAVEEEEAEEAGDLSYSMPAPYFLGKKNGGIWRTGSDGEDILVYKFNLFVLKRIDDQNEGESVCLRLQLPKDPPKDFTIASADVASLDKLTSKLASKGVMAHSYKMIKQYIADVYSNLQIQKEADVAHHQFGWTRKDSFVVGTSEVINNKKQYVPPTVATSDMVDWFRSKGDIEKWKEVFNSYGREGMEGNAFAALSAFGSPLLKIATNHKGIMLNLKHNDSGSGKTTTLRVINSVWGHPEYPLRAPHDTKNSLAQRMGVLNNIPFTIDELSNTKPEDISNLLYAATQGRGKDRMENNRNALRVNNTTWATITITSGNSSYYLKLHEIKDLPKGEIMRCVEYSMPEHTLISVDEGRRLFDEALLENYGLAWYPYICAIQANRKSVTEQVKKHIDVLHKSLNLSSAYRFYSMLGAVNIVGGKVAQECGLHDYNLIRLNEFYKDTITDIKTDLNIDKKDYKDYLAKFLTDNYNDYTLVINSTSDARKGKIVEPPLHTPRRATKIRKEPDTGLIYIDTGFLRSSCAQSQTDVGDLVVDLTKSKHIIKKGIRKGLSKGTPLSSLPTPTIVLDASKLDIDVYNDEV